MTLRLSDVGYRFASRDGNTVRNSIGAPAFWRRGMVIQNAGCQPALVQQQAKYLCFAEFSVKHFVSQNVSHVKNCRYLFHVKHFDSYLYPKNVLQNVSHCAK